MASRWRSWWGAAMAAVVADPAACTSPGDDRPDLSGATVEVVAVWSDAEAAAFGRVLDLFESRTGASVEFTSTGSDDIGAVLDARREAGDAPDVAVLPQPGLLDRYVGAGAVEPPPDDLAAVVAERYGRPWRRLTTVDGDTYGVAQGRQQEPRLVQHRRLRAGRGGAPHRPRPPRRRGRLAGGLGHAPVRAVRRPRGGLGAHRLVREPLPAHGRPRALRRPGRAPAAVDRWQRGRGPGGAGPPRSAAPPGPACGASCARSWPTPATRRARPPAWRRPPPRPGATAEPDRAGRRCSASDEALADQPAPGLGGRFVATRSSPASAPSVVNSTPTSTTPLRSARSTRAWPSSGTKAATSRP